MTTKYTPKQRDAVISEARKILERHLDEPLPHDEPPSPAHAQPLSFEDPLERWKREAVEADQRRAAGRAELRRQERDAEAAARLMDAATAQAWDAYIDARIAAALQAPMNNMNEFARATEAFAKAIDDKIVELQTLLTRLNAGETAMRAAREGAPLDLPLIHRRTN
jgi:hypothetical protein